MMSKNKAESPVDNPFAVNFDPARAMLAGRRFHAELFVDLMKHNVRTLDFLRNRFQQDIRLATDLAGAAEFDEAVCCWLDFMRQAQIDYSNEMSRLLRLNAAMAADAANKAEQEARTMTEEFAVAAAA